MVPLNPDCCDWAIVNCDPVRDLSGGRHYRSPDVALELRSNVEVECQGVLGGTHSIG
jgi:hypothetical protein